MKNHDRREFMERIGRVGAAAGFGALCVLPAACSDASAGPGSLIAWPLECQPLDVEEVRKLGHQSFYAGGCCYGTFNAIVSALRDTIGSPFDMIPASAAAARSARSAAGEFVMSKMNCRVCHMEPVLNPH